MPMARYFFFVGVSLLALLFVLDTFLPKPVVGASAVTEVSRPVVRIHSIQKLPERIVIDTSIPTIVPPPTVVADAPAKADAPVKIRALNALAQAAPPAPRKSEPKAPPKRRMVKRQVHPPIYAYAQQPRFDFFASFWR